jgi:uncharacterized protein (DUF885 family)
MKIRLWIGLGLACCGPGVALAQTGFDAFAEAVAARWMREDPEGATSGQYFSGAEQDALDRQLVAVGPSGHSLDPVRREAALAQLRREREQLLSFDRRQLTPRQSLTADSILESIDSSLEGAEFEDHRFSFDQMGGLQVSLVNFLSRIHPIRNRRDVENYLARLGQVAGVMDRTIGWTRAQDERGLRLPRFILTVVLEQVDDFLAAPPAQNVLVASLGERAAEAKDLSETDRAKTLAAAAKVVEEEILPAYRRLRVLLSEQITRATDDAGLWRLPRGAAAYASALRRTTGTELTAEEIHALGLREVARIEGEMDQILRELGYRDGTVTARYAALNEKLLPPSDPDPRPALVEEYARVVRDAEKRAAELFDIRPKARIEVRREPSLTDSTMAAHYTNPAPDGSRPGIFWAPLPDHWRSVIWVGAGLRSVTYHEGVPGHHFQGAIQQELPDVPRYVRLDVFGGSIAFLEGWALYAEKLVAEAGWYEGDKPGRLGQLNFELFRARRLVVDTGLHAKLWTRQQAIDYGIQPSEVDRYVVWPGQACSYKIGELEILRLRAKAQQALGPRFSLKQFHNAVLGSGNVSLKILGRLVDEYIAAAR